MYQIKSYNNKTSFIVTFNIPETGIKMKMKKKIQVSASCSVEIERPNWIVWTGVSDQSNEKKILRQKRTSNNFFNIFALCKTLNKGTFML
jgi:hypothetical protein